MAIRHYIDFDDITAGDWGDLYKLFKDILDHPGDYSGALSGRVLASLFFEPSTRTSFSFQSAMARLGGGVFGFSNPLETSVSKGETFRDTIIIVSGYADAAVIRHPREGAALAASLYSSCPVINAGDGGHLHPTQTLADLATLTWLRGSVDDLRIGLCGDLKNGRTVHSLLRALCCFSGMRIYLISPRELAVPPYVKEHLQGKNMDFVEVSSLEDTIGDLDALYMTRIQKERFIDPAQYMRLKGVYTLSPQMLGLAKKDMIVMHPLPRVDEISQEVDADPRAAYFKQAKFGMVIRMALLLRLVGQGTETPPPKFPQAGPRLCANPNCITAFESYLPPLEREGQCAFCESAIL